MTAIEKLRKISKDKNLIMDANSHIQSYYGIRQRYDDLPLATKEKLKEVDELLSEFLDNFATFYNFTSSGEIRYSCDYNHGLGYPFYGVAYVGVEELISEYKEGREK